MLSLNRVFTIQLMQLFASIERVAGDEVPDAALDDVAPPSIVAAIVGGRQRCPEAEPDNACGDAVAVVPTTPPAAAPAPVAPPTAHDHGSIANDTTDRKSVV